MNRVYKKTKILATVGPASTTPRMIAALLRKGANCFRLNFSHADHGEHAAVIRTIRSIAQKHGIYPGILADLQGPKIRTGLTQDNRPVLLRKGSTVALTPRSTMCSEHTIFVDYPALLKDVRPRQHILINDGAVALRVSALDRKNNRVICSVLNTGSFSSRKGVNFPETDLRIPSLTAKDRRDLQFLLAQDINYIALSFVRQAADMRALARIVHRKRKDIKLVAKIERAEALDHVPAIVEACDGIMIARGDLGIETSLSTIPIVQKNLIAEANRRGKIVIVATQMLESMLSSPLPTRAESTDVANAILDGTDAVMLSGETAVGSYPAESVDMMTRIARSAEESFYYPRSLVDLSLHKAYPPHAICEAARWASRDLAQAPVVVFTTSGDTALYLAKIRNQSPIYAFTPHEQVACMLSLAWNCTPFIAPFSPDIALLQSAAERTLLAAGLVKKGAVVLVVSGTKVARGATNFLRVKKVGEE